MTSLYKYLLSILIGFLLSTDGNTQLTSKQQAAIDSLTLTFNTSKHDSTKINSLKEWDDIIYRNDRIQSMYLNEQIEKICKHNLEQKLNKKEELIFKKGLSYAYNSKGYLFDDIGNYELALDYYTKSLKINEKIHDTIGISKAYNNIGTIYMVQKKYLIAKDYFFKSLTIKKLLGDELQLSIAYNNIGGLFEFQNKLDSALYYYNIGLALRKKINSNESNALLAGSYNNLGTLYFELGDLTKAMNFQEKSLEINQRLHYEQGIALNYYNIAEIYLKQNNDNEAKSFLEKALSISKKNNTYDLIDDCSERLYQIYKSNKNTNKALIMHELLMSTKDTLLKIDANEKLIQLELQEKYNQQKQADSIVHANEKLIYIAESKANKEEIRREKTLNIALIAFGALITVFLIIVAFYYRRTHKQNKVIEQQHIELHASHLELNETHKEITDSINYAKKIQDALMTSERYMKSILPESFIFFQSKDVVSGDFYWVYKSKKNKVYFTVADCTGHGVPGAFMSMISTSLLNENIVENEMEDIALVLDNIRKKIISSLNKEGDTTQSKDGMDIALCKLDIENKTLEYAGAFNPLIHIRNKEVNLIKADPQPVALYIGENKPFTKHKIDLEDGDMIYLFSDGFPDQFGGQKNRKYMRGKFKKFLAAISDLPIDQQKRKLVNEFEIWKGNNEQVDDVCVMGVKI